MSLTSRLRTLLRPLFLSACLAASILPLASAQEKVNDMTLRGVLETEQAADALIEDKVSAGPDSQRATSTPLATILGLREALKTGAFDRADEYLDLRYLPRDMEDSDPALLVRGLAHVWRQQNIINLSSLSDVPEGNLNDGLPPYRELVGHVTTSRGDVPMYLQRVPGADGNPVWKVSNATVAQIPMLWEELGYSPLAEFLATHLPDFEVLGLDNWQFIATVLIVILSWPLAVLGSTLCGKIAQRIPNHFHFAIQRFFRVPFRFFLFIIIASALISHLKLSLTARILLESSGLGYIAFTILALGLMSLLRDYNARRLIRSGYSQYVPLLRPFTTMLKVVVVTVVALLWADGAGYNMSTILAGLGVGSLAVALAAQKTLENVIGAITLYTARPVKPGDFCRFGDIYGTIEEIGLRSTIIRTLDFTQVLVPNSVFSSTEIENISARDHVRYYCELRLQLIPRAEMESLLEQLTTIFHDHEEVDNDTVSLRFTRIEDAAAIVRVDAGILTTDFYEYLRIAESLNLQLIEHIERSSSRFTGPGQMMQVAQIVESSVQQIPDAAS